MQRLKEAEDLGTITDFEIKKKSKIGFFDVAEVIAQVKSRIEAKIKPSNEQQ